MGTMTAAGIGASLSLGLFLILLGSQKRQHSTGFSPELLKRLTHLWTTLSRRLRLWVTISVTAGLAASVLSGWLIALVLVPAAMIVVPLLLSEPVQREVELLAALDRWVRLLGPSIATGKSIRDAIISTRHQVPDELVGPVNQLVTRLDQGWGTSDALLAMADEIQAGDTDAVLAALAIAAARGGTGARSTLAALSSNTQVRLHALREIATERAKPRAVVRQVTLITLGILGGSLLLGGSFFEPYRTPLGQLLACALAGCYIGALAILRRRTIPPPTPRFLRAEP